METEERNQKDCKASEPEFFLQWGNRKRLRCVRVKDPRISARLNGGIRRKLGSAMEHHRSGLTVPEKEHHHHHHHQQLNRLTRNSDGAILRSSAGETRKSASPEKEDRYYTTRGSAEENGKVTGGEGINGEERALVWPKLYITLSSKEKEEDFLAMKGCKLPQRPKKRAKIIQRSLLLVSPGAWLTDMCQERYEVREKKSNKKRPRGLKAMGSMESDSE
ncbi:hypothetical protein AAZX31_16G038100 [Glycine max]|uniref:DUF1639 family protein n=2 Tax=Glycine subgen. Soja TaxID=1462606 RepID=C6F120_SOYBN|nr:uncharacterized protein LOC100791380 [Glycine max]XP_028207462.1 uncharacterized protein LOC114390779 [Glycine soja]XP_040866707.1 uncharacterized protein LOC100791380 [Glycine max]ACF22880.1 unknown protein [Glycine max]KAG4940301.1 hypothetical protein JHK87_044172 [Glycine soja]KAG4951073.1 hypothetical protein JHK85_044940 [Glycine max]KAG5100959.1 hypothetical protein JHK82_046011 [Glycine max]KAG5107548.1 hypothetical protein JHK84_044455 [Glycine max]|eukprot:XP_003548739.1 uncharacterized protein LOC100791380 [Glycine max]